MLFPVPSYLVYTKETKRPTRFHKVKHSLGKAYDTSMKWVSVADRGHKLLSKGYSAVGDRLEPEVQDNVGGALYTYVKRRKHLANVDTNLRRVGIH